MDKKNVLVRGLIVVAVIVVIIILYLSFFRTATVTFSAKFGAGIKAQEVKVGELAQEPTKPTREGYEFIGWYLDDKPYDFNEPVKKDITLEAKWEKTTDK